MTRPPGARRGADAGQPRRRDRGPGAVPRTGPDRPQPGRSAHRCSAAARDETDHLAWCERRVRELGSRTSLLAPVWYAGSFAIGALAGLSGDRTSLGFVEETEKQVVEHLESHLHELPAGRRALPAHRCADEGRRGAPRQTRPAARARRDLPRPVRELMRRTARVMTARRPMRSESLRRGAALY